MTLNHKMNTVFKEVFPGQKRTIIQITQFDNITNKVESIQYQTYTVMFFVARRAKKHEYATLPEEYPSASLPALTC